MPKRVKVAIVDVLGVATIQTIAETHRKLFQELEQSRAVELRADAVEDFDLTFVQLVESARQYATEENKTLVLSAPAKTALRDVLQRGGFVATAADRAFWFHESGGH